MFTLSFIVSIMVGCDEMIDLNLLLLLLWCSSPSMGIVVVVDAEGAQALISLILLSVGSL